MLKKTITYTDYNDETRTEDFYFNLSKAELMEMNLSTVGGLGALLDKIIAERDIPKIAATFKDIILRAYGKKSDDGRRFIKSPELREEFSQTEAYSELFMELSTNEDSAAAFINGIVPKEISEQIDAEEAKQNLLDVVK